MDIIKSDIVSLHGAAISMIGGRPENQDDLAYLDTPLGFLILVCDGMGGGPGGKTASSIVKHEMAKAILECSSQTPRDHAFKIAAARAHQALEEKMKENPALSGMGSTFVAVLLNKQSAIIAHAGDSRCYRLHRKKCLFRTQDHSLVAELVKRKVMTEEEARRSPQSNVITRGLGSTNNHVPEIDEVPYRKGDRFVLCTDGIWGSMQHRDFLRFLTPLQDIQQLISNLSVQVDNIGFSKGGGHDNHTIAMFELENDSELRDSISWKKWTLISSAVMLFIALVCLCLRLVINTEDKERTASNFPILISAESETFDSKPVHKSSSVKEDEDNHMNEDEDNSNKETRETDSVPDNKIIANGVDIHKNDTLFQRLVQQMSRKGGESDSVSKQNPKRQEKKVTPNPVETTQKIINRYDSAKVVRGETIEEAQKKLDEKKAEIKDLFVILSDQTVNNRTHTRVLRISNVVDNPVSWYVDKEPDKKTKLYGPTRKSKDYMDNQIERLRELKDSLEIEKKN